MFLLYIALGAFILGGGLILATNTLAENGKKVKKIQD